MSSLQEYFLAIDGKIKEYILEIASIYDLSLKFTGYYIENNRRSWNSSPSPFYKTYEEYRDECPYDDVTHVRYFFELTKGDEKRLATVHLGAPDFQDIHFSIEELGGGVEILNPEQTHLSDFDLLMSYVKTKFS